MADAGHKLPLIEIGYSLFLGDGGSSFGAVRRVLFTRPPALEINVENAGDFRIPLGAVEKVVSKRVVVRWEALPPEVQEAIGHTHEREDFPPPGEEVELVRSAEEEDLDEDDASRYDTPPMRSAPGELPGRDAGSYGAPPSIGGAGQRRSGPR